MNYNGWVESIERFMILGWAVNSDDFSEKIYVDFIINDKLVATRKAYTFRADIKAAGVSDGYAVFHFCPFYWLQQEQNHIRIVYSGTDITIPNGEKILDSGLDKITPTDLSLLKNKPKISIVLPVYNVETQWLSLAIKSVRKQIYENWELCIVDDASPDKEIRKLLERAACDEDRIKVQYLERNRGVSEALNAAVSMATGEYVGFLDHDDELFKNALYEVVKTINEKNADIIYSDEHIMDITDGNHALHFKADYSPDLLLSHNYITHFLVVKKTLIESVGGFSSIYDGAQDYDLILKLTEKSQQIVHIPKLLYSWRIISTSQSLHKTTRPGAVNAGFEALKKAVKRRKINGDVIKTDLRGLYSIKRHIEAKPVVSIIIPFKDNGIYLKKCIDSIIHKTTYNNYEIVGINNNSVSTETYSIIEALSKKDARIKFYDYPSSFNYSKINNYGVSLSNGSHIVLMNSDIDIITPEWIEALLEHSQRIEVGGVGAKLFYPDDTIQHAGIIIGIAGFAGHSHKNFARGHDGYYARLKCTQNISAVTGALMMCEKNIYEDNGGLDEINFSVALNDVDFCLRLRQKGYLNIFTPFCEAYHHESASRGYENTPEKEKRFQEEISRFRKKWKDVIKTGDPYYNPNLTLDYENFSYKTNDKTILL